MSTKVHLVPDGAGELVPAWYGKERRVHTSLCGLWDPPRSTTVPAGVSCKRCLKGRAATQERTDTDAG